MRSWPAFKAAGLLSSLFDNPEEVQFWSKVFDRTYENPANQVADTWDYQWMYVVFCQNGLCINPQKNLISNIGFGENATHTLEKNSPRANRPTFNTEKIIHPVFIYGDKSALDKITGSS